MSVRPFALGLAVALLGASMLAAPATAADLDPTLDLPPAPPIAESKVEFGTGWYIRGDIGATKLPSLKLATPAYLPTNATSTLLPPGASISSGSDYGYDASLGAGYQITNYVRTDVMFDFHQPLTTTGYIPASCTGCTDIYTRGSLRSYDVLSNGYVDLGTWWRVTPYVGAGIGLGFGHYQVSSSLISPQYQPTQASGTYYNFAYAFMAGLAIDVYDHTKLDIGYRYLNLGGIPGMSGTLSQQEVRAGLRYMIDN